MKSVNEITPRIVSSLYTWGEKGTRVRRRLALRARARNVRAHLVQNLAVEGRRVVLEVLQGELARDRQRDADADREHRRREPEILRPQLKDRRQRVAAAVVVAVAAAVVVVRVIVGRVVVGHSAEQAHGGNPARRLPPCAWIKNHPNRTSSFFLCGG